MFQPKSRFAVVANTLREFLAQTFMGFKRNASSVHGSAAPIPIFNPITHPRRDSPRVRQGAGHLKVHSPHPDNVQEVIRGIAERANVLALDAAIEAARSRRF